jgi:hypothetical protein
VQVADFLADTILVEALLQRLAKAVHAEGAYGCPHFIEVRLRLPKEQSHADLCQEHGLLTSSLCLSVHQEVHCITI